MFTVKMFTALAVAALTNLLMSTTKIDAIAHTFDQFLCRNTLNFATTNRTNEDRYRLLDTNPPNLVATDEDKNYFQINFNILNSEGIKGFVRSKNLERLIFTTMQDLHCAGYGDKVYYLYTMPFWNDINPYDKETKQLSTYIPEYYTQKYYGCNFQKHNSYYTASSAAIRLLKTDANGNAISLLKKNLQIVHAKDTDSPQFLCPEFSYKYPACEYYDISKQHNLNSTKPFKKEFSMEEEGNVNEHCVGRKDSEESYENKGAGYFKRDKVVESISYPYGTGYVYGSKPSPLIVDMNINLLDNSRKNFSKYTYGLYPDDYFSTDLTSTHDQYDKRATFLESHTYTGTNFYDGRTDIDYNEYIKDRSFITNQIDFRIPPFNVRGSRPIFEQFSYQFNLKRDLLASLAYASDTRFHQGSCDKEKKINVVYDEIGSKLGPDGYPINATLYEHIKKTENWHSSLNSNNTNCWGDVKATKVLITVVSDEPQDFSSNLDIMWRMYKSHYELAGSGSLDDRIRGWERATGHKFVDFSTRVISLENFNRELALEQLADSIVDRDIRHIVLVIDSKNATPFTKFVRKKTSIDSGPDDLDYNGDINLLSNFTNYAFYREKYTNGTQNIEYKDTGPPITVLDFIIGYHGANVYNNENRRLDVGETIKKLEEIGMGRSLQAMVLKNGGYFSVFLAKDLQIKPMIDYKYKHDDFTLFDLIESATAFRKITFKTPKAQRNRRSINISPYKPMFPGNNRTEPEPVIPSYYNPRYNPVLRVTPVIEKIQPVCYDFPDIEDLITRILLAGSIYDTNYTSLISILISQALHNIHNFVDFMYEKLPIHKLMETYYHEPIIIARKEMVFNGKSPYYLTNLCSDKDEILKRKYTLEEKFEEKLKETMPCEEDDPKNCLHIGFVIKLSHFGFEKLTHRPNYKAKVLFFCADKPSCEDADSVPFNYISNTISTNLTVDPIANPFTIRSKLEYMRVYNAFEFYLSKISELESKALLFALRHTSHIPDTFYRNTNVYATLKNSIPQRIKDHYNKGIIAYSTAINGGYAYKRMSTQTPVERQHRDLLEFTLRNVSYKDIKDLPQVIKYNKDNPEKIKHAESRGLAKILAEAYPEYYPK